ncbi:MAG: mannonate dehydratase, partial [Anaerolineales bacterium]|nr:mannonate dehydratase [Anaerolineales bacterium]
GPLMGKGALESIAEFGGQGKIFKVHMRNVTAPLPHFVETFIDDGYMDMYRVFKQLAAIDFNGVIIPDHIPLMANDHKVGTAYTIGYMKALLRRVADETS